MGLFKGRHYKSLYVTTMNKIFLWGLGLVFLAGTAVSPVLALAQTTTQMTTQEQLTLIAQLTAQIQTLQQQLQQLQAQRQSNIVTLLSSLSQGSSGQQVSALQAILAADPTVYPEGLITGYYGPLTAQAVKRFQAKHGIKQAGVVGPKTLGAINAFLKDNPLAFENQNGTTTTSTAGIVSKLCAIVPPGHLIAPGWLRKHGGEIPIIPACQTLPPGIGQQFGDNEEHGTSITNVATANITTSSAYITWTTNHLATSYVWMSATTPINTSSTPAASSAQYVYAHSLAVSGLSASTTYYYIVGSQDQGGGHMIIAGPFSFTTTQTAQDVVPPVISNIAISGITATSATVAWQTNENANGTVWYGTSTPVTAATATSTGSATLVQNHSVTLVGLAPSTTYYAIVASTDAVGNRATSSQVSFATAAAPDVTPPTISNVNASNVATSTAHITWATNELATSGVWYSTSTPINVAATSTPTISDSALVLNHDVALSGLAASSTYYYVVGSTDAAGNAATSTAQSLVTSGL